GNGSVMACGRRPISNASLIGLSRIGLLKRPSEYTERPMEAGPRSSGEGKIRGSQRWGPSLRSPVCARGCPVRSELFFHLVDGCPSRGLAMSWIEQGESATSIPRRHRLYLPFNRQRLGCSSSMVALTVRFPLPKAKVCTQPPEITADSYFWTTKITTRS